MSKVKCGEGVGMMRGCSWITSIGSIWGCDAGAPAEVVVTHRDDASDRGDGSAKWDALALEWWALTPALSRSTGRGGNAASFDVSGGIGTIVGSMVRSISIARTIIGSQKCG